MKTPKMFIFILLSAGLMIFSPLNTFSQEKPIELRLAHMMPVGSPSDQHIKHWAEKIASDSNGRLKIRIYPVNTLIPGPEIYDGVVKGAADIGLSWRYKPEGFSVGVTFPFILGAPDTVTASRIYDDIWKKFPKVMANEWKDVKILYVVPSVPNHLAAKKPLHKIEDIKGLQFRVPSREGADFVKELGGTPVFMSSADFVIAIEKGTVDGAFLLSSTIADYKLAGKIRYIIMDGIGFAGPVMLIMNKDSFNKLSADLQGVLDKSCEWAKDDALKYWSATLEDAKKYFKAEGVEQVYLSREEKAKFVTIYDRCRNKIGADLDAKGFPGTEIVRFIKERVEHYAR